MKIYPPLYIVSRLLPGCRIGDAEISIKYSHVIGRRQFFRWYIDTKEGHFSDNTFSVLIQGTLQQGLEALLGFLGAYADEDIEICPPELRKWAVENTEEISVMALALQGKQLIEE